MYLDVPPLANRRTPFEIEYPLDFVSTINFTAPSEFTVRPPDKAETRRQVVVRRLEIARPCRRRAVFASRTTCICPPDAMRPASIAAYDEAMETAVSGLTRNVTLKRGQ